MCCSSRLTRHCTDSGLDTPHLQGKLTLDCTAVQIRPADSGSWTEKDGERKRDTERDDLDGSGDEKITHGEKTSEEGTVEVRGRENRNRHKVRAEVKHRKRR